MRATDATSYQPAPQQNRGSGNRALRRGRVSLPNHVYLITTITCQREPVFSEFAVGCAAARCFDDPRLLGDAQMLAWVLMPDHVHWLIRLGDGQGLGAVVNRLKSGSARAANKTFRRSGSVWTPAFHDHALRTDEDLRCSARYVITNPVRAGLVERIDDYPFWNAIWL